MNTPSNSLLLVAQAAPGGAGLMNILFIGFMFAAMWFLIIQPQRKKQKEHAKMIEALTTGDEIVTAGGIYGEITAKRDDRYVIRIAEGVKVEVAKSFVHDVVRKDSVKK
ncbi:MAG: preprotein translocase subunit YajC [Verrucomicrobia bacterium]|nr:preprotein translocase subunit YajC [Verrucomicrobiota bacterium]